MQFLQDNHVPKSTQFWGVWGWFMTCLDFGCFTAPPHSFVGSPSLQKEHLLGHQQRRIYVRSATLVLVLFVFSQSRPASNCWYKCCVLPSALWCRNVEQNSESFSLPFLVPIHYCYRPPSDHHQTQNLILPKTSCPQSHCLLCLHMKRAPNIYRGTNGLHQTCPGCFECFGALSLSLFGFVVWCDFSSFSLILAEAEICRTYTPKKNPTRKYSLNCQRS